jgi:hypothetical protein
MRISERRECVSVSIVAMLMCSNEFWDRRGWETRVDERERVRRKEGVEGGIHGIECLLANQIYQ